MASSRRDISSTIADVDRREQDGKPRRNVAPGESGVFTEAELKMIDRDDALRLMPTLRPV
jgi:hypothetical protein